MCFEDVIEKETISKSGFCSLRNPCKLPFGLSLLPSFFYSIWLSFRHFVHKKKEMVEERERKREKQK
jgi:hypothetical protein